MTSRSFKSVLSALLLGVATLAAQTPPQIPAATPVEKKPKEGYLRFWNLLPKEAGNLTLLHETGTPEGTPLIVAASMNYYASYVPTKPARYALKVIRAADPKTSLKTFDVVLKADVFVTFLARVVEGKLSIEMLDDTYDPEKALTGTLTVRHCVPDTAVTITSAATPAIPPLTSGEQRTIENLPLKPVYFKMQAKLPSGQIRNWSCEVDFKNCRHASLWLVQDAHGRFRPRVSPDGQNEVIYTEK